MATTPPIQPTEDQLHDLLVKTQAQGDVPTSDTPLPSQLQGPSAIQGSINEGQVTSWGQEPPQLPPRPIGTGVAAQPVSKGEFFRKMLGDFFYAAGTGLANRGSGPGADARGAGAALTALPERDIQRQQLEIARQQAQGLAAYHASQAQALQNRYGPATWIDEQGNPHQMSAQDFAKLKASEAANQAKENVQAAKGETAEKVAGITTGSKEKIAAEQTASKEKLAGATLTEKANEFKTTDEYKKWKTKLDNETKIKVADLTASKAPAAMLQTSSFADGALTMLNDADSAMKRLEAKGVFASNVAQNKAENWIFGKGLVDPSLDAETRKDIGTMRAAMGYTSTAAMRAHTGRTSREIYDDFKQRLGAGQDWSALRGAMDETRTLMTHYRDAATNANIKRIRSGGSATGGKGYSPDNPFAH
jgi:hypothetical protein